MSGKVIELKNKLALPAGYRLADSERLKVEAAFATFDGSAAASAFEPCLTFKAPDGRVLNRVRPSSTIAAGGTADVSYAPFPGGIGQGGGSSSVTIPGLLAFVQLGADTAITATTQAGADVVMTAPSINFDGVTTARIDMDALTQVDMRAAGAPGGNGGGVFIELWDNGAFFNGLIDFGVSGIFFIGNQSRSVYVTPTVGAHVFSIRAYRVHGAGVGFPNVTIFQNVDAGEPTFATNLAIIQVNPQP